MDNVQSRIYTVWEQLGYLTFLFNSIALGLYPLDPPTDIETELPDIRARGRIVAPDIHRGGPSLDSTFIPTFPS
jgi:hypothetical protein